MLIRAGTLYKTNYLNTGEEFYAFITKVPENGIGLIHYYDLRKPDDILIMGMGVATFFFKDRNCLTKLK